MIKTLFKMEFRRAIKANLWWSIGVALMIYLIIVLYPLVDDIYAQVPPEMMAILEQFGGIPTDVLEYYATEGAMMLQLFGAIYAALLGFNLISVFEKERLAEILYTQAIPKRDFYVSKLMVLVVMIIFFTLINGVVGYVGFLTIREGFSLSDYVLFTLLNGVMYLHIALLSMGLALYLNKDVKAMIALAIPLPLYILSIVSTLTDHEWLKRLKYISPFTYSDPVSILKNQADFEYISFFVFTGIILVGLSIGYDLFKKRISVS